jgi:VanZ family protein
MQAGSTPARAVFGGALIGVLAGAVADLGQTPAASLNDKVQHVLAFGLLALLACRAMPNRPRWRFVLPLLFGFGLLIECVQWWLPWREFSLLDLAADLLGLLVALGVLGRVCSMPAGDVR